MRRLRRIAAELAFYALLLSVVLIVLAPAAVLAGFAAGWARIALGA
jgi:hypothetical protein